MAEAGRTSCIPNGGGGVDIKSSGDGYQHLNRFCRLECIFSTLKFVPITGGRQIIFSGSRIRLFFSLSALAIRLHNRQHILVPKSPITTQVFSPMTRDTGVQFQVESYQGLKKWYFLPPCLLLSIIRYISMVKWSNLRK